MPMTPDVQSWQLHVINVALSSGCRIFDDDSFLRHRMDMTDIPGNPFLSAFRGSFTSMLRWSDFDAFWAHLKALPANDWYVYAPGEPVPTSPVTAEQFFRFLDELHTLLRSEHQEDYCGIVYADDKDAPAFIKIYDPNNLGVVCGYSDNPPLPGWTVSKLPPVELNAQTFISKNRQRWWQRLFGPS